MPRTLPVRDSAPQRSAPPAMFACSLVNGDPDSACVHVAGELDLATTPKLEVALRDALRLARLVVLDLRDVAFIDSSGVFAIVNANDRARMLARRLVILRGPAHVDRIFTLTRTAEQLEFAQADSIGPLCTDASRHRRSITLRNPPALRAL